MKDGVGYEATVTFDGAYQLTSGAFFPNPGPYTVRLTDIFGESIEATGIPLSNGVTHRSTAQFTSCEPFAVGD
jgi:hypothetical protein